VKVSNSMLDALQSGLIIMLLVLWTIGLALAYVLKVLTRWGSRIASRQGKRAYVSSLPMPFESTLPRPEKGLS
jgi:hypothetical protein